MTVRNDVTIDWAASPRIIEVAAPSTQLRCQDLLDTLRSLAAQPEAMDEDEIVDASGKDVLGGGMSVGLTVKLLNAQVRFAARPGPETVQCVVKDGTLVTADGSPPVAPSAYTAVAVMNQVGGVIATGSGDVDAIAAGVWSRPVSELGAAGTVGKRVADSLDAPVSSRAEPGAAMTLESDERWALAEMVWNLANKIEEGVSPAYALRAVSAILVGLVTGGPDRPKFRGIGSDAVRVEMVADENGNRTQVVLHLT